MLIPHCAGRTTAATFQSEVRPRMRMTGLLQLTVRLPITALRTGLKIGATLVAVLCAPPAIAQSAGTLISASPVAAPSGMQAWRIVYRTADDRGRVHPVTGMVAAPSNPMVGGQRKVIAWTHGTWGTAQNCAPSLSPNFFQLTPALDAVRNNYVVVAPDYPGLGSPGPHPYLVGTVTARSTLDAIRASRSISGASAGSRFAVWGESQGGHAALWTGQLARVDGAGLTLVGVAAGAPVTDLAANFRGAADPNAKALLTALAADSWSKYYKVPLNIGRRATPAIMRRFAGNCISVDSTPKFSALLGILALRRDLKGYDFPGTKPWSSFVAANSVTPISRVPILLAQTVSDPLVSPLVTRQFARRLCRNRVRVRYITLPGGDHATTARQSAAATLQWIDDRFAGSRAPSDCGQI